MKRLRGGWRARRRARLARGLPGGALRAYYRTPPPALATDAAAVPWLAVDVETTGLEPARDALLAIGAVPIDGERIRLAGAWRRLVRPERPVAAAEIHGIGDDAAAGGAAPCDALDALLARLAGRVLVAHHATIELAFLGRLCERCHGAPLLVPAVDTLRLARASLARRGDPPAEGALRLGALRERRGLPRYRAHDALTDALACAELLLAEIALRRGAAAEPLPLARLLHEF